MNSYEGAWAYLQGAVEALTPLMTDFPAAKLQAAYQEAAVRARQLAQREIPELGAAWPSEDSPVPSDADIFRAARDTANAIHPVSSTSPPIGVYVPHDLSHAGDGTFTEPGPDASDIEAMLEKRYNNE